MISREALFYGSGYVQTKRAWINTYIEGASREGKSPELLEEVGSSCIETPALGKKENERLCGFPLLVRIYCIYQPIKTNLTFPINPQ